MGMGIFGDSCANCGRAIYNGTFCTVICAREFNAKKQNQIFYVGQRVRLKKAVEFRDGGAVAFVNIKVPAGVTGTVVDVGDDLNHYTIVQMESKFECLADLDNSMQFGNDKNSEHSVGWATEYLEKFDS